MCTCIFGSPLPGTILIDLPDMGLKWEQIIDYKNISFRCRVKYDHLDRNYHHTMTKYPKLKDSTDYFQQPKHKEYPCNSSLHHGNGFQILNKFLIPNKSVITLNTSNICNPWRCTKRTQPLPIMLQFPLI